MCQFWAANAHLVELHDEHCSECTSKALLTWIALGHFVIISSIEDISHSSAEK